MSEVVALPKVWMKQSTAGRSRRGRLKRTCFRPAGEYMYDLNLRVANKGAEAAQLPVTEKLCPPSLLPWCCRTIAGPQRHRLARSSRRTSSRRRDVFGKRSHAVPHLDHPGGWRRRRVERTNGPRSRERANSGRLPTAANCVARTFYGHPAMPCEQSVGTRRTLGSKQG